MGETEKEICELHNVPLVSGKALYIHDSRARGLWQVWDQFPNANAFKLYGSPMMWIAKREGKSIPRWLPVEYCPECRRSFHRKIFTHSEMGQDLLRDMLEFQEEYVLIDEPMTFTGRVYFKASKDGGVDTVLPDSKLWLSFNGRKGSRVVFESDEDLKGGSSYDNIKIKILNPDALKWQLKTGARFYGVEETGKKVFFGELKNIAALDAYWEQSWNKIMNDTKKDTK